MKAANGKWSGRDSSVESAKREVRQEVGREDLRGQATL